MRAAARTVRRSWLRSRASMATRPFRPKRRPLLSFSVIDLDAPFSVAVVGRSEFFVPYRDALTQALQRAGSSATSHDSFESIGEAHAVIVVGPHQHSVRPRRRALTRSLLVAIQTEQLPTRHQRGFELSQGRLADYLSWSVHYDLIVEWNREAVELLRDLGPTVLHVPHGHLDLNAIYGIRSSESVAETHEVLFLGGLGGPQKRRRRLVEQLRRRFDVHPATGRKVWGEEKVRALQESQLVLNLHSDLSMAFPSPRFFETLSLGRPLLSEAVSDPWPFVSDVDFLEAPQPGLIDAVGTALSDAALRARVGAAGRAKAQQYSMDLVAKRLLGELIALHRAVAR
jgi:hypothetical protein